MIHLLHVLQYCAWFPWLACKSRFETREKEFASSLVSPRVGVSRVYGPAVCVLSDGLPYIDGEGVRALQQHPLQKSTSHQTVPYVSEYQVSYTITVMTVLITYSFLARLPIIGHFEFSNLVSVHLLPFSIEGYGNFFSKWKLFYLTGIQDHRG